jgi:hypothetical protein
MVFVQSVKIKHTLRKIIVNVLEEYKGKTDPSTGKKVYEENYEA